MVRVDLNRAVLNFMCPKVSQEKGDIGVFPFLSIESSDASHDAANENNLNTANQALHNMYVLLARAGYAMIFFERGQILHCCRFERRFEVRVDREVELDQGLVEHDFTLGFQFDVVLKKHGACIKLDGQRHDTTMKPQCIISL